MQSIYKIAIEKLPGIASYCIDQVLCNMASLALRRALRKGKNVAEQLREVSARVSAIAPHNSRMYIYYHQHTKSALVYIASCLDLCQLAEPQIGGGSIWTTLTSTDPFGLYLSASYEMLEKAKASLKLAIVCVDWMDLCSAYTKNAFHVTKLIEVVREARTHKAQLSEVDMKALAECDAAVSCAYHIWCKAGAWMTSLECHIQYQNSEDDAREIEIPSHEEVIQLIKESNEACAQIETYVLVAEKILAGALAS